MSEHFTHIAVYEDCARMLLASPEINDVFKQCLTTRYDSGLLGSTSRGNHIYAVPILEKYKDTYASLSDKSEADIHIAYAIGWLLHRASDLQMKPLFRRTVAQDDPRFNDQTNSIYHDVNSFLKIYDGGHRNSLSPQEILSPATFAYDMKSHPGAAAVNAASAEPLFSWMWQKDMMSMQIFVEAETDFQKWVDTFVERFPDFSENFSEYEKAFNDPDPVSIDRYWVQDRLYFDDDPAIAWTRAVQQGETPPYTLTDVLKDGVNKSEYGQAIRNGYWYVKVASDYFVGKATKHDAYEACRMDEQFRF